MLERDGDRKPRYFKVNGSGTEVDPYVPIQDVNIQDQHTRVVDLFMISPIDTAALTVDVALDDRDITFDSSTPPVVGNTLCLKESGRWMQSEILVVVDNTGGNYTVTVDSPADYAFTVVGHETCAISEDSLNVNGSVTSVHYYISPPAGTVWDITRVIFSMGDDTAGDEADFGGIADGLTNGIVLRKTDGDYNNIFNAKTNGDFGIRNFDFEYTAATVPQGIYGFKSRRTFAGQNKNGVTIRLDGDTGDKIEVIVQDDLTSLAEFKVVVQGHVVTD